MERELWPPLPREKVIHLCVRHANFPELKHGEIFTLSLNDSENDRSKVKGTAILCVGLKCFKMPRMW